MTTLDQYIDISECKLLSASSPLCQGWPLPSPDCFPTPQASDRLVKHEKIFTSPSAFSMHNSVSHGSTSQVSPSPIPTGLSWGFPLYSPISPPPTNHFLLICQAFGSCSSWREGPYKLHTLLVICWALPGLKDSSPHQCSCGPAPKYGTQCILRCPSLFCCSGLHLFPSPMTQQCSSPWFGDTPQMLSCSIQDPALPVDVCIEIGDGVPLWAAVVWEDAGRVGGIRTSPGCAKTTHWAFFYKRRL